MDHRGHGLSDRGPVSIEMLATDMAGLMDAVGLRGAIVCGVSVGGMAAQALCAARPDLVRAALLICTGRRIGDAASWDARIAAVREGGMAADGGRSARALVLARISERSTPSSSRAAAPCSSGPPWRAMPPPAPPFATPT